MKVLLLTLTLTIGLIAGAGTSAYMRGDIGNGSLGIGGILIIAIIAGVSFFSGKSKGD